MTINEIKAVLEQLNFPNQNITEQTAICILALSDKTERNGLLPGHRSLNEGARIHDILNFARDVIGKRVAENTREAYRKTSLAPLMNHGLIIRHQLSTNDPNTYYRLHPDLAHLLAEKNKGERDRLVSQLQKLSAAKKKRSIKKFPPNKEIVVTIDGKQKFSLSPGEHNLLERSTIEILGQASLQNPQVVYIGDTAPRKGYQNRNLMRRLNLPIDTSTFLPDVILYSESESHLVVVEAVMSSGPVNAIRLEQLHKFTKGPKRLGIKISYITAFPSRAIFRRFVEEIAWGSSIWIENEPNNIIHFERIEEFKATK